MKKGMNILCLLLACLMSCSQEKSALDPTYNITLDSGNTYVAGEPVKFNIKGNIDNILFYSGEEGSDYMAGDKGIVIKNIQNYLHSYEYTWNTYGTYKAVFAGTELLGGQIEEQIREFTITVLPGSEKDEPAPEIPEPDEEYDVFLLIGQSNMAGRGEMLEGDDKVFNENVFILDGDGKPVPASNPLNQYSTIRKMDQEQKIGPGFGFSKKVAEATGRKILLVVNARGGSNIEQWDPKSEKYNYYEEAVRRTRQALEYGELKGVLWHQGCSDVSRRDIYMDWLKGFVSSLRADLGHVPFVVGELGQWRSYVLPFNEMLHTVADHIPDSDWVSSDGGVPIVTATSNGEPDLKDAHFNRASQITLGERYAEKILKMCYE